MQKQHAQRCCVSTKYITSGPPDLSSGAQNITLYAASFRCWVLLQLLATITMATRQSAKLEQLPDSKTHNNHHQAAAPPKYSFHTEHSRTNSTLQEGANLHLAWTQVQNGVWLYLQTSCSQVHKPPPPEVILNDGTSFDIDASGNAVPSSSSSTTSRRKLLQVGLCSFRKDCSQVELEGPCQSQVL